MKYLGDFIQLLADTTDLFIDYSKRYLFYRTHKPGRFYRIGSPAYPEKRLVRYISPDSQSRDFVVVKELLTGNSNIIHWTHVWYGRRISEEDVGLELLRNL